MPSANGRNRAYGPSCNSEGGKSNNVWSIVESTSLSPVPTVIKLHANAAIATTSGLDFLSDSTGKSKNTTSCLLVPA